MISVVVKGDEGYAERIISKLRWFTLAESLGGVESLVSQPFSMTHASIRWRNAWRTVSHRS